MKRTIVLLSACAVTLVSLSGCGWFRGGNSAPAVDYPADVFSGIPASGIPATPVTPPVNTFVPATSALGTPPANASIDRIIVYRNPVSPEQLIVEVSGSVPNGCSEVGPVDYRVVGNSFQYTLPLVNTSNGGFCAQAIVPFSKKMGLNASGQPLASGTYNVQVNGNVQPFNI